MRVGRRSVGRSGNGQIEETSSVRADNRACVQGSPTGSDTEMLPPDHHHQCRGNHREQRQDQIVSHYFQYQSNIKPKFHTKALYQGGGGHTESGRTRSSATFVFVGEI